MTGILRNKKATFAVDTFPFYIIFAVLITFMWMAFIIYMDYYARDNVTPPKGFDAYMISQRFFRSPDCFTYQDISGRTYPMIIDANKFNDQRIASCYIANKDTFAYELTLSYEDKENKIRSANWNTNAGLSYSEAPKSVLVRKENSLIPGKMKMSVQNG
jgi:hypothetical protein